MNYYEHHLNDFAEATAHLSPLEDGLYSRMIRKYYSREQPLPDDPAAIARWVGARTEEERAAVARLLEEFFTRAADGWHNARCDEEIALYRAKQDKGRRGAEARWRKRAALEEDDAVALPAQCGGIALALPSSPQSPDPNHQQETPEVVLPSPAGGTAQRASGLCAALRSLGIAAAPHMAAWRTLLPRYPDEAIVAAARRVRDRQPGRRVHLNYLVTVLADGAQAPPPTGREARIADYFAQARAASERRNDGDRGFAIDGEVRRVE